MFDDSRSESFANAGQFFQLVCRGGVDINFRCWLFVRLKLRCFRLIDRVVYCGGSLVGTLDAAVVNTTEREKSCEREE